MNASTKQRTELSGVERAYRERKVTLVFDEDAGVFKGNPFKIETPYGTPCTVARGDMCSHADALEEICHALADEIEARSGADRSDALKLYRAMFDAPPTPEETKPSAQTPGLARHRQLSRNGTPTRDQRNNI